MVIINCLKLSFYDSYLLSTPPSREAFKHSGGDKRLCTSAMVTLYFDVLDSKLNLPGTAQKTSLGEPETIFPTSFELFIPLRDETKIKMDELDYVY